MAKLVFQSFSSNNKSKDETGLEFNTQTGEITGKATNFLTKTTFTVRGSDACEEPMREVQFDMSVTTKFHSLEYKQKSGKKLLLELSSN